MAHDNPLGKFFRAHDDGSVQGTSVEESSTKEPEAPAQGAPDDDFEGSRNWASILILLSIPTAIILLLIFLVW